MYEYTRMRKKKTHMTACYGLLCSDTHMHSHTDLYGPQREEKWKPVLSQAGWADQLDLAGQCIWEFC